MSQPSRLSVTIISIVRIKSLIDFTTSFNPTWEQFDVALWSTVEVHVGVICACMPSLQHIIQRLLPSIRERVQKYGHSHEYRHGGSYVKSDATGRRGDGSGSEGSRKTASSTVKSATQTMVETSFEPQEVEGPPNMIVQTKDFVLDYDDESHLMTTIPPGEKKYEIPKVYDLPT
jgi:hypothetical protein